VVKVKDGDTVKVHYTGKFKDGTIFDSSVAREPLVFQMGAGQLIKGFESAVLGMEPGESKTVNIVPDEAYGPYLDELVQEVDCNEFPEGFQPEPGMVLQFRQPDGETNLATVIDVSESSMTLDGNHPLAGKGLTFEIELVEIV
jgi:FKBP-type peptidyl-prolyl cis-trans isomerase 2